MTCDIIPLVPKPFINEDDDDIEVRQCEEMQPNYMDTDSEAQSKVK